MYKGSEAGRSSRRNGDRRWRSTDLDARGNRRAKSQGRIDKRREKMASKDYESDTSLDTINQFLKEKEYV